jgi:hypothetical protein
MLRPPKDIYYVKVLGENTLTFSSAELSAALQGLIRSGQPALALALAPAFPSLSGWLEFLSSTLIPHLVASRLTRQISRAKKSGLKFPYIAGGQIKIVCSGMRKLFVIPNSRCQPIIDLTGQWGVNIGSCTVFL